MGDGSWRMAYARRDWLLESDGTVNIVRNERVRESKLTELLKKGGEAEMTDVMTGDAKRML